jgi:hypothetical protein
MTDQPRGIRNNNPGNIDRNTTKWQGMADDQSSDPRFVVFKTPQAGIRALAKILLTYQNHDGLKTVRGIIGRWAPAVENNTSAYVAAVAAGPARRHQRRRHGRRHGAAGQGHHPA